MNNLGIEPRPTTLTEGQWAQAVELWREGLNTYEIAFCLDVHESVVYNGLPWRRKEFAVAEVAA